MAELREDQWQRIKDLLPGSACWVGQTAGDNRLFVEAVCWIGRNGARWRALPAAYGKWNSVYIRFHRWSKSGVWQRVFDTLAQDADTEWLMLDSTIIRANHCAAGAKKSKGEQALGRSRGGFGTKIHALCDALGNPLRFILSAGQRSDYTQALTLLNGYKTKAVLADRGYDADYIVDAVREMGAMAVIPSTAKRKTPREINTFLYKERNRIECLFNKLKNFRRVATRYDKLDSSFLSFVQLAGILILLK